MSLENRKAYIDFLSPECCKITTLFRQKSFDLEDRDVIDLIKLKKLKEPLTMRTFTDPPCPFFATAIMHDDEKRSDHIIMEVYAVIDPSTLNDPAPWGHVSLYNGPKNFRGKIYVP